MEDFRVVRKLGKGGQGTTLQVQRKVDGLSFVVKQVVCESIVAANQALKEAKTLQRLEHTNICRYEDVFLDEQRHGHDKKLVVCIVMEFCEKGDLSHAINHFRGVRRSAIPEAQLARWLHDICEGLRYVHAAGVLHRDLKTPNIFISRDGKVKLGDFGLARQVTAEIRSRVGTPCYLAPEVMQSDSYSESADVWGAGCIALEAVTLTFLWERKGVLAAQVLSEPVTAQKLPPHYSEALRSIICSMLDKTPQSRPSVAACVAAFARFAAAAAAPARAPQQRGAQQATPAMKQPDLRHGPVVVAGTDNLHEEPGQGGNCKQDAAIDGVHAAVEAAKQAAKHAALAAGHTLQAINGAPHAGSGDQHLPALAQQPRHLQQRPQRRQHQGEQPPSPHMRHVQALQHRREDHNPHQHSTPYPHQPPPAQLPKPHGPGRALSEAQKGDATAEALDAEVKDYESVLRECRQRFAEEGVRRVGLGGRDLSASGYPLVLKTGLEIFVSDEDLLAGMTPFMCSPGGKEHEVRDEDVVRAALKNRGFHMRYIQIDDSPRTVATIAARMLALLREQKDRAREAQDKDRSTKQHLPLVETDRTNRPEQVEVPDADVAKVGAGKVGGGKSGARKALDVHAGRVRTWGFFNVGGNEVVKDAEGRGQGDHGVGQTERKPEKAPRAGINDQVGSPKVKGSKGDFVSVASDDPSTGPDQGAPAAFAVTSEAECEGAGQDTSLGQQLDAGSALRVASAGGDQADERSSAKPALPVPGPDKVGMAGIQTDQQSRAGEMLLGLFSRDAAPPAYQDVMRQRAASATNTTGLEDDADAGHDGRHNPGCPPPAALPAYSGPNVGNAGDGAVCQDPHGSQAAMDDLLKAMGMGMGGGECGNVACDANAAWTRLTQMRLDGSVGESVQATCPDSPPPRPPPLSLTTMRGGNAQSPPEKQPTPRRSIHAGEIGPPPPLQNDSSPQSSPSKLSAMRAKFEGQTPPLQMTVGVAHHSLEATPRIGMLPKSAEARVDTPTAWPGADTFPNMAGHMTREEAVRLQRLLQYVHGAELTSRKAEELARSRPYAEALSDGSLLRAVAVSGGGDGVVIGVLVLPSGARFAGQIKDGRMHGAGGVQWPQGTRGPVVMVGNTNEQMPATVTAYLGEFREGFFEGKGRAWLSGGVEFCGEFRQGVRQGWGCETRCGTGETQPRVGSFVTGQYVSGLHMASIC